MHINNLVVKIIFFLKSEKIWCKRFYLSDHEDTDNSFDYVEKPPMQIFKMKYLQLQLGFLYFLLALIGRNNINTLSYYDSIKLLEIGNKRPVDFDGGLIEYAYWYRAVFFSSILGAF